MKRIKILSDSPQATRRLAAKLLTITGPDIVFALHGGLRTGKTCFVQGLALALEIEDSVSSPTFTIIREHVGKTPLIHMDLYRLGSGPGLLSLDIEKYFESPGVKAIEWAEYGESVIPSNAVRVFFKMTEEIEKRMITVELPGEFSERIGKFEFLASLLSDR